MRTIQADVLRVFDNRDAFKGDRLKDRMFGFATDTDELVVKSGGEYKFFGSHDGRYVKVIGDTMTGALAINTPSNNAAVITLAKDSGSEGILQSGQGKGLKITSGGFSNSDMWIGGRELELCFSGGIHSNHMLTLTNGISVGGYDIKIGEGTGFLKAENGNISYDLSVYAREYHEHPDIWAAIGGGGGGGNHVLKSGDTMTGPLKIQSVPAQNGPALSLAGSTAYQSLRIGDMSAGDSYELSMGLCSVSFRGNNANIFSDNYLGILIGNATRIGMNITGSDFFSPSTFHDGLTVRSKLTVKHPDNNSGFVLVNNDADGWALYITPDVNNITSGERIWRFRRADNRLYVERTGTTGGSGPSVWSAAQWSSSGYFQ